MVKFFRNWCEQLIISSFIVSLIEMLAPEGKIKKYIRVVTGVYMIFVILNPILIKLDKVDFEEQINIFFEVSSSSFDEEKELQTSFEILNTISENLQTKEEDYAGEIQE